MQSGVLHRDRQAEPGATESPGACRIGAPEPVEDPIEIGVVETVTMVPHRDGDRLLGPRDPYLDRLALSVFDRVGQQIAQDPLDAAGVDGRHAWLR